MKLDFSEVKENSLMQEGTNHLTIIGAKEGSSANGTHMLTIDFKDANGAFTRDNVCLEGAGAFRAKQLIKALGLEEEDFKAMEATELIGSELDAEIFLEEYNGQQRAKIKKYLA